MREFKALNTSKRQEKPAALFSALCPPQSAVMSHRAQSSESERSDNMQSTLLNVFSACIEKQVYKSVLKDYHRLEQRITIIPFSVVFTEYCC